MQKQGEKAWGIHHVIRGMADVMDPKCNSIFTFLSIATEKLEN